jgi:hypothetical protein
MVISALKSMIGAKANKGLKATDEKKAKKDSSPSPISRAKQKEISKPKAPPAIELNIGPHDHIKDKSELENKSAQKILSFYQHGEEVKNKAGEIFKTEAFLSEKKDELLVHIPASVAAKKLVNSSFFEKLTSVFKTFKANDALTRLKEGNEIDLISEDNEPTDPKKLKELTDAGVYSFVAVHKTNDKGDFPAKADLLVPVMDLHALLEHLKNKVPKGIPKEVHEQFKKDVEKMEANPKLKDIKFIDEALPLKANKGQYETENELRKALCSVTDVLSLNSEVLVSSDLVGKGEEGKSRGKEYSAFNFNYPVISKEGSVSIVEHPMTLVRREERKTEALPPELNRVMQWHFMSQLKNPDKIGGSKEVTDKLGDAFNANAKVLERFSKIIASEDSKDDK